LIQDLGDLAHRFGGKLHEEDYNAKKRLWRETRRAGESSNGAKPVCFYPASGEISMKKWTTFAALAVLGAGATSFALRAPNATAETAKTTAPIAIGQKITAFSLPDPTGKPVLVGDWDKSKATVLMFVATQCPVSNDYNARMAELDKKYSPKGIKFVGINSNKAEPGPEVAAHSKENGFGFPVLKDPQNTIADRFEAKVTPEIYIVSAKGDLIYRGRIDNSQKVENVTAEGKSLQIALDAIVGGKTLPETETRAFGCSIKRVD
jgi:thiol-disulfide isomerase/thioredoxin